MLFKCSVMFSVETVTFCSSVPSLWMSLDVSGPLPCTQWTSSLRASPAPARFEINSPGVTPKALTICAYIHWASDGRSPVT